MDILDLFRKRGEQLFWHRLDDGRVTGRPSGEPIEDDKAYFNVRLAEMFLGTTRELWRKRSPLVHGFVRVGEDREQHTVAGPGQLQELSDRNLDRVIVLNYLLAGPIPHRGEQLNVLAGLYSVAREDTAAALISTVGTLAGLVGGPTATGAADIAAVVKTGVDSILGLGETKLKLGVNDTFSVSNPLRSGFLVGIAAPTATVDVGKLWIQDGQLKEGNSAALADPYRKHDYFVVYVERQERRPDWPGVPGLAKYEQQFKAILSSGKKKEELYQALATAWPEFHEALVNSPHLTRHDADEIADDVQADLKIRVEKISTDNPFERHSFGGGPPRRRDPRDVDFAAVPEREPDDPPGGAAPFAVASS
jgi:hypothetical protein